MYCITWADFLCLFSLVGLTLLSLYGHLPDLSLGGRSVGVLYVINLLLVIIIVVRLLCVPYVIHRLLFIYSLGERGAPDYQTSFEAAVWQCHRRSQLRAFLEASRHSRRSHLERAVRCV